MRGYGVHLFFHLLAIACGAGCGVAAALWWHDAAPVGLWLAVAALAVGVLILTTQAVYIANQPAPAADRRSARSNAGSTRDHAAHRAGSASPNEPHQRPQHRAADRVSDTPPPHTRQDPGSDGGTRPDLRDDTTRTESTSEDSVTRRDLSEPGPPPAPPSTRDDEGGAPGAPSNEPPTRRQ